MAQNVFIVEDNPDLQLAMKIWFEDAGFIVSSAPGGESFKSAFIPSNVDVVVLDVGLPDASGQELCEFVRSNSDCPIIMFTGEVDADSVKKSIASGATDYVLKTNGVDVLVKRVKSRLDKIKKTTSRPNPARTVRASSEYATCKFGCRSIVVAEISVFSEELSTNLSVRGWDVQLIDNYEELLEFLSTHSVQAIVLIDSFVEPPVGRLAKELKTAPDGEHLTLIGVSLRSSPEKSRRLASWVDEHFNNPCNPAEIADKMVHSH